MRKILFLFLFAGIFNVAFSQVPINVGDQQLNFGLGNHGNSDFRSTGVYVGFDYCVVEDLTIGGNLVINHWSDYGMSITVLTPAFVADYHFNTLIGIPSEFDFYAGANIGLPLYFGSSSGIGDLYLGLHTGGRWYWNDKWGVNLQLGLGILSSNTGGSLGLSMRL